MADHFLHKRESLDGVLSRIMLELPEFPAFLTVVSDNPRFASNIYE